MTSARNHNTFGGPTFGGGNRYQAQILGEAYWTCRAPVVISAIHDSITLLADPCDYEAIESRLLRRMEVEVSALSGLRGAPVQTDSETIFRSWGGC